VVADVVGRLRARTFTSLSPADRHSEQRECADLHDARQGRSSAGNDKEKFMYRPHTNQRRRAATAATMAVALALAVGACGSDGTDDTDSSSPPQAQDDTATPAETAAPTTSVTPPPAETTPATEPTDTATPESAPDEAAIAQAALLQPADIGDGWQDFGSASAFPMSGELAATVPSCAQFVDVVFEGNTGVWAHTTLGREMNVTFTSVTVFPTEAEAAAMVAATATPEFDECWADFNEVAVVELPFGIESAVYESVDPPDVELGGDSSSLHALEGTMTIGATNVPDSCVCAFVQQGRTVVTFHSAAPVFTAAARRDLIATALARVDETVV
jgi:hypothetical protein